MEGSEGERERYEYINVLEVLSGFPLHGPECISPLEFRVPALKLYNLISEISRVH